MTTLNISNVSKEVYNCLSSFRLATNALFTTRRKTMAADAMLKFKFNGEQLADMESIAKKGYVVKGRHIWTIHYNGGTKKSIFFYPL
jgi:hypothetical protein